MSGEIVVAEPTGVAELMRRATDVAGVCKTIVTKTAKNIQGRRFVQVEGWQSLAAAFGCTITVPIVEAVPGGIRAVARLLRQPDGAVLAEAEGFVGDDEPTWAKRPMYARRAMAGTRAQSRVCRSVFAFVITLMDAGLETVPAEEVPDGGFVDAVAVPVAQKQSDLKAKLEKSLENLRSDASAASLINTVKSGIAEAQSRQAAPRVSAGPTVFPGFGRAKGQPIRDANMKDLEFYANAARRSLADPEKSRFHAKEAALLEAIMDEMARQSGPPSEEPPPPSDADAPPEAF